MPIFTKGNKKVLFIHIPKTAGVSIYHVFDRAGWQVSLHSSNEDHPYYHKFDGSLMHLTYNEIEQYYDISSFNFVFSIVRNPYERSVSEYHWQKQHGDFDSWFVSEIKQNGLHPRYSDNHFVPQTEFVGAHTNMVYKLEQGFQYIVDDIETRLDAEFPSKQYYANLTNKTITVDDIDKQLVYNAYKQDFERFGYDTTS